MSAVVKWEIADPLLRKAYFGVELENTKRVSNLVFILQEMRGVAEKPLMEHIE